MIKVFYDGACGLCAKEIRHYELIAPQGIFHWVDISKDSHEFESLGFKRTNGLKALHVVDDKGQLHIGVDAFITIWKRLDGWKILGFLIELPVVKQLTGLVYRYFAKWRFIRMGYID
jgi:predicted DCC family thiol-disulfide oxidoreductase YuxK